MIKKSVCSQNDTGQVVNCSQNCVGINSSIFCRINVAGRASHTKTLKKKNEMKKEIIK